MPIDADDRPSPTSRPSAARVDERRRPARPSTPPPWRPDLTDPYDLVEEVARIVGYDQVPSVLPRAAAGRGLTREQRLRRRVGRTLAGAGCVEVISFPFVGDAALRRARAARRRRAAAHRAAGQPAVQRGAVATPRRCCPGLLKAAARNLGRGAPGVALFETGTVAFPVDRGPAPIYGVDRRPTDAELAKLLEALPRPAAAPRRSSWPASASAPAGGARAARPAGPTRSALVRRLGRRARRRRRGRLGRRGRRGTPAAAPRCSSAAPSSATPASCTRRSARRSGCRARSAARRDRPRRPDAPRAATSRPGPDFSTYPLAKEDVALVVDAAVTVADGRGGAARRRRRPARVDPALRRLHRRPGRRGPQVAGLRAALPGPRPHPDRGGDRRPRATRPSRSPPSGTGAVQR